MATTGAAGGLQLAADAARSRPNSPTAGAPRLHLEAAKQLEAAAADGGGHGTDTGTGLGLGLGLGVDVDVDVDVGAASQLKMAPSAASTVSLTVALPPSGAGTGTSAVAAAEVAEAALVDLLHSGLAAVADHPAVAAVLRSLRRDLAELRLEGRLPTAASVAACAATARIGLTEDGAAAVGASGRVVNGVILPPPTRPAGPASPVRGVAAVLHVDGYGGSSSEQRRRASRLDVAMAGSVAVGRLVAGAQPGQRVKVKVMRSRAVRGPAAEVWRRVFLYEYVMAWRAALVGLGPRVLGAQLCLEKAAPATPPATAPAATTPVAPAAAVVTSPSQAEEEMGDGGAALVGLLAMQPLPLTLEALLRRPPPRSAEEATDAAANLARITAAALHRVAAARMLLADNAPRNWMVALQRNGLTPSRLYRVNYAHVAVAPPATPAATLLRPPLAALRSAAEAAGRRHVRLAAEGRGEPPAHADWAAKALTAVAVSLDLEGDRPAEAGVLHAAAVAGWCRYRPGNPVRRASKRPHHP